MKKHTVKMLADVSGHDDNNGAIDPAVTRFKKGGQYNIGPLLLQTFIHDGVVELVNPESPASAKTRETKVVKDIEAQEPSANPVPKAPKAPKSK